MNDNKNSNPAPQPKRGSLFQQINVTHESASPLALQKGAYLERPDNITRVAIREREIIIETDSGTYECGKPQAPNSRTMRPLNAEDIRDALDALGIDNVRELTSEREGEPEPWIVKGTRK